MGSEMCIRDSSSLRDYLFDTSAHASSHRRIHSIILSSASAFYWPDRCDVDTANALNATSGSTFPNQKSQSGYVKLASNLRSISSELSCPVIYTTWNLSAVQLDSTAIRPSLPTPWPSLPTLRLIIQRRPVRKLPGAVSAEEALRDREDRNAAVAEGWFDVFVNGYGSEEWPDYIREGLRRTGGNGGFAVRIKREGMDVDDG